MDIQQAVKTLGLSGNESVDDINTAYQAKLSLVESKCESAPTEALKEKFEQFKAELTQAQQVLTAQHQQNDGQNEPPNQPSSPLSQTKMHDLPETGSQATTDALEVGSVLAERYQIKAFIAQGGMGAVYRAFDKNRNQDIAIKVMLPQLMQNESARERFLDEARLSSQLSHPNIVNVFDVIQDDGLCFLTMELLEGQDLRELMQSRKLLHQNFSMDEVLEILEPICAGLNHAHELTVHRDIKPENIFLTEDEKYKLMDFGIARVMSGSQRTQTGAATGTAYYMAPEQLKGSKNIDGRADQYALAVLTYELLSGDVPAGVIEPLHVLVKGVSKKVSSCVQKALSAKAENRFENLNKFLSALKGKDSGAGLSMPSLPLKGIGIAAVAIIAILGIGSLASNGGLDSIWQAIKPVDKALIAEQKAQAQRLLNDKKAEVAKLQGEIKNYQKRLNNGQRNLKSDIRDAQRNESKELKYLQHWQRLTNDYIFDGDDMVELEGELSKGDNLLRQGTTASIEQANTTLTKVRDGYKNLWAQFNAAEHITRINNQSEKASVKWRDRQSNYQLDHPAEAITANEKVEQAANFLKSGDFVLATSLWREAINGYETAYLTINQQIIDLEAKAKAGSFIGCLRGNCQNGKGTYYLKTGGKYVGSFIDGKRTGKGVTTWAKNGKFKGDKYVGSYINGQFAGQGTYTWVSGNEYFGNWVKNNAHGKGTKVWANGDKYVGDWVDDKKTGRGKYTWSNGNTYVGDWVDGKATGKGTYITTNGNKYVGEFVNNKKHGQGTFTWASGTTYTGDWVKGNEHGKGTKVWANGDKYVGEFVNKKLQGQATLTWANGNTYTGDWVKDNAHGKGTKVWVNGDKYVGDWVDNKRTGKGTLKLANGDYYVGEYVNDMLQGQGTYTWADGTIYEGMWYRDQKVNK